MSDEEITPEIVREAARILSPEYNFAQGYRRAMDRSYWFFIPACLWMFAVGWTFGVASGNFPWGSYIAAFVFTCLSFIMVRRMK